jgi:competence protein ComEA
LELLFLNGKNKNDYCKSCNNPLKYEWRNMKKEKKLFVPFLYKILAVFTAVFMTGCSGRRQVFQTLPVSEENVADTETVSLTASAVPEISYADPETTEEKIVIYVCGAVRNPGVYELEMGSRIYQAVEAAGGFAEEASREAVNQARKLSDEEEIYIPTKEETAQAGMTAWTGSLQSSGSEMTSGGKVNLNTADVDQLMTLSGIGQTRAEAILAYREEHGGFSSIEEIMNVQGIKEGTFAKIKDEIVVE